MTTQIRPELKIEYVRGTERSEPEINIGISVPFRHRLRILFWLLLGRLVWYTLSEDEIELISRHIIRWRVVTKLRNAKKIGRK